MRATVHKLNDQWLAVPALGVDLFLGILRPNDNYIKEYGLEFFGEFPKEQFKEGKIIIGQSIGFDKQKFQFSRFEQ